MCGGGEAFRGPVGARCRRCAPGSTALADAHGSAGRCGICGGSGPFSATSPRPGWGMGRPTPPSVWVVHRPLREVEVEGPHHGQVVDPRSDRRESTSTTFPRALGGALRMARIAVQRAPRYPRRPHVRSGPTRPRLQPQRAGPRVDNAQSYRPLRTVVRVITAMPSGSARVAAEHHT